jgi:hypothetical protein
MNRYEIHAVRGNVFLAVVYGSTMADAVAMARRMYPRAQGFGDLRVVT